MYGKTILAFLFFVSLVSHGQLDSIQKLDEVVIADYKLYTFSKGYKVEKIDLKERQNRQSLTEVLRANSLIYFKENGFGMVSSPSFRGTNASHTAVIWNGININSNFTGQTDFNVISPLAYDEISIRSGGGSVQYGSGAIGGSVHLNNSFSFGEESRKTKIRAGYGSFDTYEAAGDFVFKNDKHYLNTGINFTESRNDYPYVGKGLRNEHGQFSRLNIKANGALKIGNGLVGVNSEFVNNDRDFSGSLTTIGKDGYKDIHSRNLLQYNHNFSRIKTSARLGHLYEEFQYFPNTSKPNFDYGKANTFIANTEAETFLYDKLLLNGKLEYSLIEGSGTNTGINSRKNFAAVLLLNHGLSEFLDYGINFRQEFNDTFENPFLISADAKYQILDNYKIRINGSKNYRVPTFNDLFWSSGGNPDLKPEKSLQLELGQELQLGNLTLEGGVYFISSRDMIKWIPVTGTVWSPVNIAKSENKGVEITMDYFFRIGKSFLRINGGYAYTDAKDLDKDKQLIYVPFHNANARISFETERLNVFTHFIYNGNVFDTTDNSSVVKAYEVVDFGCDYEISKMFSVGGSVKNLFNKYYENVAYRPMPSRSFNFFVNLNI